MDGVKSLAVQGHCCEERDNTQMHRGDLGEALKKNDKSRSWGRWDNEQRCRGESMCLCANWRGTKAKRDVEKKGKLIAESLGRKERNVHTEMEKH